MNAYENFIGANYTDLWLLLGDNAYNGGLDNEVNTVKIGASNVNAFVGVGGPLFVDSNGDGIIDAADTPQSDGAMGLCKWPMFHIIFN